MKYKSVNSLQNSPRYFKLQFKTIEFSLKKRFSNWGVTVMVWRHFFVLSGLKISTTAVGLLQKFHCRVSAVPTASAETSVSKDDTMTVLKTRLFQQHILVYVYSLYGNKSNWG